MMSDVPVDLLNYTNALVMAAEAHRNQRRKATDSPYIEHPIRVSHTLIWSGLGDWKVHVAALLHDTLEDTDLSAEKIQETFGNDVLDMVKEVTDDKSLPKEERKRLQVSKMLSKSKGAQMIKMADKLDNIIDMKENPPTGWTPERQRGYVAWALAVTRQSKDLGILIWDSLCRVFDSFGLDPAMSQEQLDELLEEYYKIC